MNAKVNAKQEIFCQLIADGKIPAGKAYTQAGWKAEGTSASTNASRLLKKANINARIAEIQAEMSKSSKMSRENLRDYLISVLTTPAGQIDRNHQLCQSYKQSIDALEVKLPDKLRASEQLAKMMGWNEPEKVNVDGQLEIVVRIGGDAVLAG